MAGAKRRAVASANSKQKRKRQEQKREQNAPKMSGISGSSSVFGPAPGRASKATKARSSNRAAREASQPLGSARLTTKARAAGIAYAQPKAPSLGDKISTSVGKFVGEVRNYSGPHTPLGGAALQAIEGKKNWDKVMGKKSRAN